MRYIAPSSINAFHLKLLHAKSKNKIPLIPSSYCLLPQWCPVPTPHPSPSSLNVFILLYFCCMFLHTKNITQCCHQHISVWAQPLSSKPICFNLSLTYTVIMLCSKSSKLAQIDFDPLSMRFDNLLLFTLFYLCHIFDRNLS